MVVNEISAKSILSASKIYTYVINPYVGCQFGCSYCYARYMKKFTGHREAWGEFVDVKVNAAELLRKEIRKKKRDRVWISGVCDPYQPLEARYKLTRECLKILSDNDWPVVIQTRSKLVVRDIDILQGIKNCDAGMSVTTADDRIRKIFEPRASFIMDRVNSLKALHDSGIRTYAMIAPILPGAENLMEMLEGKVDYIYVDRMNYDYAKSVYRNNKLEKYLDDEYFEAVSQAIADNARRMGIECHIVF
ncbi:MAG: radical SAM protein [Ignavibacteria bacterium]|jgi:DNA repair photolyase|nr:radical SAM protein [Ignavibacteria bacterium]MCU7504271.1 radical SAM protein [Ignavibacteria bacterium]MCU7516116.1 radical SAM protein [Ignavibacteria bacterium]